MNRLILLANLVALAHALVATFIFGGLVLILSGQLLAWRWTNNLRFRSLHLVITLIVGARVWLGVACPFSTAEEALRPPIQQGAENGFVQGLHLIACRNLEPKAFARAITLWGALTLITFYHVRKADLHGPGQTKMIGRPGLRPRES